MQFVVSSLFFVTLTPAGSKPTQTASHLIPLPSYVPTFLRSYLSTSRPLYLCNSPTSLRPLGPPLPVPAFPIHVPYVPYLSIHFPTFPYLSPPCPAFPIFPYLSLILSVLVSNMFLTFSTPFPNTTNMFPTLFLTFSFLQCILHCLLCIFILFNLLIPSCSMFFFFCLSLPFLLFLPLSTCPTLPTFFYLFLSFSIF